MKNSLSLSAIFSQVRAQCLKAKDNRTLYPIHMGYVLFFLYLAVFTTRFFLALILIDESLLPGNIVMPALFIGGSILLFIMGTRHSFYNFHYVKTCCLGGVLYLVYLALLSFLYRILSALFLPGIMGLPTDEAFTENMVLVLARLATQLPLLPAGILLGRLVFYPLTDEETRKRLLAYKTTHSRAQGSGSPEEICYDMNIVRDIKTGKYITVFPKDRFLHTLVDGTSGTGKTSSTILPAIRDDLNMHCRAEAIQKKKVKELIDAGEVSYSPPAGTAGFSVNDCIPIVRNTEHLPEDEMEKCLKARQEKLEAIRLGFPVCGITVLAPDDSLTDDVCRLCDARGVPYYRIDAVREPNGLHKKNTIGLNPFYIPADMEPSLKNQLIVKKAVIFSDVMQAITDLKGKADSYFTGLNRQMIANLAILVMVTVPLLRSRQATPADLQAVINNFSLLPEYADKLEEIDRSTKYYTFILQYIREDLLGKGREKMEDQSRGTRNIINEFLLMPANREIFCSQKSIDFDRTLANGEVTVCNYNLASGDTDAVAFGLFFLLSFNNAVLSRPGTENTRIPHFFYVDELPVLIHPSLEKNFSLFRKFRVGMIVAIQTIDQMEKNEITKYLKGVLLGCAHIIVFGRSALSDMKIFSALAGIRDVTEEQKSTTETAITDDSPHYSYSTRETPTQKNAIEEIDIRMKDFQEVTFFTTRDGRPLPPFKGTVEFLKPSDWTAGYQPPRTTDLLPPEGIAFPAKEIAPAEAAPNAQSAYRFLEGTPLSLFETTPPLENKDSEKDPALLERKIPEGSENIDDIL